MLTFDYFSTSELNRINVALWALSYSCTVSHVIPNSEIAEKNAYNPTITTGDGPLDCVPWHVQLTHTLQWMAQVMDYERSVFVEI